MKNVFLLIFLSCFSLVIKAQLTVTLPTITANPGATMNIPVRLIGASSTGTPISGANIQFTYDPTVLTFVNLVNFYSGTPQNQWFFSGNNGIVAANWLEPSLGTVAIPDSTALYEAQFTYNGGTSPLTYTVYEFTDAQYNIVPTTPVNGAVSPTPQPQDVTFIVDMSNETISPDGIHIAGSFNNWNPSLTPMTAAAGNIYSVTLSLMEDESFTYRFVNGITTAGYEIVPSACGVPSGTGLFNRIVTVPSNDTILDTVCFASCVQCPMDILVTFRVDMSEQAVAPEGVHLSGTFNNWSTTSHQMALVGNDVYSLTLMMTPGQFHLYRFVNGNTVSGYENVPAECGIPSSSGGYDRYIAVPDADSTLPAFCFGSCVECGGVSDFVEVVFSVDMQNQLVSNDGIHIAGSFQGWNPGATQLTNTSGSVYTYAQSFLAGSVIQYRYVNGNDIIGYESVPEPCAADGNRYLNVPSTDTVLSLVCFSSCDSCIPSTKYNVTFIVDMSLSSVSPEGIHLAGSFQGWDTDTHEMLLTTNNQYSITLPLTEGPVHNYRFVNGNTLDDMEIVPSECADNGNRILQVNSDTILAVTCFAKCTGCWAGSNPTNPSPSLWLYQNTPNPFHGATSIKFTVHEDSFIRIRILDIYGRMIDEIVNEYKIKGTYMERFEASHLSPGVYTYQLLTKQSGQDAVYTRKMLIE